MAKYGRCLFILMGCRFAVNAGLPSIIISNNLNDVNIGKVIWLTIYLFYYNIHTLFFSNMIHLVFRPFQIWMLLLHLCLS